MLTRVVLGLTLWVSAGEIAKAASTCQPVSNSARILRSAAPNDIHPDWRGESYVGLSWSVRVLGKPIETDTGTYLKGNLVSPRGGVVNRKVFIIPSEWECSR